MDSRAIPQRRRTARLKEYDYAMPGAYFVTICTRDRQCLFGTIAGDTLLASETGHIAAACWKAIPEHFAHVELDAFVVMPNHIHGVIVISSARRGMACHAPTITPPLPRRFGRPPPRAISAIVGSYKSAVTRAANELTHTPGAAVWQRNYHEHIVRNDDDLNRIRAYIHDNPVRWAHDDLYSAVT